MGFDDVVVKYVWRVFVKARLLTMHFRKRTVQNILREMLLQGYNDLRPKYSAARTKRITQLGILQASFGVNDKTRPAESPALDDPTTDDAERAQLDANEDIDLHDSLGAAFSGKGDMTEDIVSDNGVDIRWDEWFNLEAAVELLDKHETMLSATGEGGLPCATRTSPSGANFIKPEKQPLATDPPIE